MVETNYTHPTRLCGTQRAASPVTAEAGGELVAAAVAIVMLQQQEPWEQ